MTANSGGAYDEILAVGQMLMLETQPDVAECAIVAYGNSGPARPACRNIFVHDAGAVGRSAALRKRRVLELSPACFVVQFDRKRPARASSSPQHRAATSSDALQTANLSLDKLYRERSGEALTEDLDAQIEQLEARAAAIIAERSEARLLPLQTHFANALRSARELLGKE